MKTSALVLAAAVFLGSSQPIIADSFDQFVLQQKQEREIRNSRDYGPYPKGASSSEILRCQILAATLADAADARDRGFPIDLFIKSQLQGRFQEANEETLNVINTMADVAYKMYPGDSPEQLRYTYNKACMSNIGRKPAKR